MKAGCWRIGARPLCLGVAREEAPLPLSRGGLSRAQRLARREEGVHEIALRSAALKSSSRENLAGIADISIHERKKNILKSCAVKASLAKAARALGVSLPQSLSLAIVCEGGASLGTQPPSSWLAK